MTDETLREFISRRKRELENLRIAARNRLAEIEAQLTELEQAENVLPPPPSPLAQAFVKNLAPMVREGIASRFAEISETARNTLLGAFSYQHMTIKQLVLKALLDKQPVGLSTARLRDFIRDAYGRDIDPNSLRPQLARLKSDGLIQQAAIADGVWQLTPAGALTTAATVPDEPSGTT